MQQQVLVLRPKVENLQNPPGKLGKGAQAPHALIMLHK